MVVPVLLLAADGGFHTVLEIRRKIQTGKIRLSMRQRQQCIAGEKHLGQRIGDWFRIGFGDVDRALISKIAKPRCSDHSTRPDLREKVRTIRP